MKSIDEKINVFKTELNLFIEKLGLNENIIEFDFETNLEKINKINSPGIYFIEILNNSKNKLFTDWYSEFEKKWNSEEIKNAKVPKPIKKQISVHQICVDDWTLLYIGKSKNIGKRVNEHITHKLEAQTYSMKIKQRNLLNKDTFRVKFIKIETENYSEVMPIIENKLRNKFNPIIGKK